MTQNTHNGKPAPFKQKNVGNTGPSTDDTLANRLAFATGATDINKIRSAAEGRFAFMDKMHPVTLHYQDKTFMCMVSYTRKGKTRVTIPTHDFLYEYTAQRDFLKLHRIDAIRPEIKAMEYMYSVQAQTTHLTISIWPFLTPSKFIPDQQAQRSTISC